MVVEASIFGEQGRWKLRRLAFGIVLMCMGCIVVAWFDLGKIRKDIDGIARRHCLRIAPVGNFRTLFVLLISVDQHHS